MDDDVETRTSRSTIHALDVHSEATCNITVLPCFLAQEAALFSGIMIFCFVFVYDGVGGMQRRCGMGVGEMNYV